MVSVLVGVVTVSPVPVGAEPRVVVGITDVGRETAIAGEDGFRIGAIVDDAAAPNGLVVVGAELGVTRVVMVSGSSVEVGAAPVRPERIVERPIVIPSVVVAALPAVVVGVVSVVVIGVLSAVVVVVVGLIGGMITDGNCPVEPADPGVTTVSAAVVVMTIAVSYSEELVGITGGTARSFCTLEVAAATTLVVGSTIDVGKPVVDPTAWGVDVELVPAVGEAAASFAGAGEVDVDELVGKTISSGIPPVEPTAGV